VRLCGAFGADVKTRLRVVTQIREAIEIVHTAEYDNFLRYLLPVFAQALRDGRPVFVDGEEHKIRNVLLEILNRFPATEVCCYFANKHLKSVAF
jgi:transformation/transcription domain-associated protein